MARIVFTPSGHDSDVAPGTTVLDAARANGVDLDSVCGGRGICGRCAVVPSYGSFPKWAINSADGAFGPFTSLETAYAERKGLPGGLRLGCQLHVTDDAVIDVPASSQVHRPVVRKSVDVGDLVVDPIVQLYYVVVEPAHLGDDRSASERLIEAVARDHHVAGVSVSLRLLPALHRSVNDEGGTTVAVARGHDVIAIWPGYVGEAFGIAIDIGSTTVAGHLCDLHSGEVLASAGLMNPQIRFGEDLMSRVSYVMMNPGGDVALTAAIREALDDLIGSLVTDAGTSRDRVLDLVLVGNPIMHHIVLGIDPTPLGGAPFELAVNTAVNGRATDVGCALPNANLYIAPCIAGHVGADTAAAILSEGPHRSDRIQLLVDVGTNAEIVLGNSDRLYAASSPTGPAFEGAQISCGQRATVGAIERVRIDRTTLEPTWKLIGHDVWDEGEPTGVCGSGIIEVIGELFLSGILRTDGTFNTDAPTRRLVADGRTFAYVLHGDDGDGLRITQNDIRAIQLAKSALRAGIELLRDHSGFTDIDDVRLAGAFGSHIDPLYALVLGLVPDCPVDAVRSAGNAAGSGAVRALLSAAARVEMETVVAKVTKIETALEPAFQQHFVDAMGFPHTVTPTPHLALAVTLPAPSNAGADSTRRRSRRTTSTENP
jgi:uncharacterized 2Fe-2S/4Fe-4S cluster protein (DUF4445 family)